MGLAARPIAQPWRPDITDITAAGVFSLGDRTVNRLGYGAMQLAGPGVFGPPRDRHAALAVLREIDEADRFDDWLYLPETLYAFMLIIVVSAGAGPYSLDALILSLMNKHVA